MVFHTYHTGRRQYLDSVESVVVMPQCKRGTGGANTVHLINPLFLA